MTSPPQNTALRAGLYMVASTACFVFGDSCVKLIGGSLPVGQIISLIGVFSTLFIIIICVQQGILKNMGMIFTRHVLLRSLLDVLGSFMFVSALMMMPIANLVAIMQTVPLVVVVVSILFLGEKAGFARILSVIVGFIGVLLIVKPVPQSLTLDVFLAIGVVVVVALRDIITKRIDPQVPLLLISLANALFVTVGGFGLGLFQGLQSVDIWQWELLATAGLVVTVAYIFIVATIRMGDLSATAPFRYAEVVFAILAGIFIFSEYPDTLSYVGIVLIVAAGLYAARHESARTQQIRSELMPPPI
jgi:drug/metabolite transporter (DMT)-like permease